MTAKALSASAEGFIRGSISASLTIACQAGKLGAQLADVTPGMVGAFTAIVLDTMKNGYDVARGKMTPNEMAAQLTKELVVSGAAIAAGTGGQALLPELPVLGYMLGSFVGSVVASVTYSIGEKTILSFCADTGFSFFGLVEQNYELPKEIIERLGLEVVSLEHIELNHNELNKNTLNRTSLNRTKYNTLGIMVLILTFVIEHNRCFIKEFFLPVAEQVRRDIIFGCEGIEIFLSLKQLDYKV